MIYRKQFLKDTTITAAGIFCVLLAVLVFTQGINLLGRAADGRVAAEAVAALIGFWTLGMTPLLLVLTAYISILTVLTRYWRDSEMAVWLACGLGLRQWLRPISAFTLPLAVLAAVLQLAVLPQAERHSREYADILKHKQNLSLVESGVFRELGKKNGRVYFVEHFDAEAGKMQRLFLRESRPDGGDSVIFARSGHFDLRDNVRTLVLEQGYRYTGAAGRGDFEQISFDQLRLALNSPHKPAETAHRRTLPTAELLRNPAPQYRAELMWRVSLPISLLLLGWLALPLSYVDTRSGQSYHVIIASLFFLVYQNGLTLLRDMVEDGKIPFLAGLLPMHLLMGGCVWLLLRMRSMPAMPFGRALRQALPWARPPK
ncbi:LPS export ABC transporter permease LptF [Conchiformibius kuhniae]|uniref:Lipopolysaccharide export system permease protein LptF n=1 Tax=Conchiformibius kuhniae TaxID=211502 RepID=A0A8T9MXS9_9NEIS|nr:LPS export ABC transporter permease LptF [Conchiformibius kuhniae]UOP05685.1 LPS export ABC transporter permease LptF [Conchiformibius kuhniae]